MLYLSLTSIRRCSTQHWSLIWIRVKALDIYTSHGQCQRWRDLDFHTRLSIKLTLCVTVSPHTPPPNANRRQPPSKPWSPLVFYYHQYEYICGYISYEATHTDDGDDCKWEECHRLEQLIERWCPKSHRDIYGTSAQQYQYCRTRFVQVLHLVLDWTWVSRGPSTHLSPHLVLTAMLVTPSAVWFLC